ncbi:protein WRKY1-like [Phragmites australis]|uniref:protein WRKY1-like n=1 Tax=Phragmites australis TaxID=29695 RepID=UPI002D78AB28|nr:protein WRKY1-like [Phragmites australis]
MERVEEANRAAVESCKKLVSVLSRPGGDPFRPMAVATETDEAVARFGKVVAVLSDRLGHARARVGKSSPPVDASCLLDHPSLAPYHASNGGLLASTPATLPAPPTSCQEMEVAPAVVVAPCANVTLTPAKFDRSMFLETPLLDLNSCSVLPSTAMAVQKNSVKAGLVQHNVD